MTCPNYAEFKLISQHYGDDKYMTILENNIQQWLQWAFLRVGAWTDVDIPQSGGYGGDFSRLRSAKDPNYTDGQAWEGVRKDWVYETGVDYVDSTGGTHNPNVVGTPEIDGTPTADPYYVDYKNGRIIFDTEIATTSIVKVAHAYRNVQVYRADSAPWYQEIQYRSLRPDSSQFTQIESGVWSPVPTQRIQLPCIVVGVVPAVNAGIGSKGDTRGYQLGNGKLWINQEILFHIFSETRAERNDLCSTLITQTDKVIWLYDTNAVGVAEAFPLDYRGEKAGSNQYLDLVSETGYRWRNCRFIRGFANDLQIRHPNLYEGQVRLMAEFDH